MNCATEQQLNIFFNHFLFPGGSALRPEILLYLCRESNPSSYNELHKELNISLNLILFSSFHDIIYLSGSGHKGFYTDPDLNLNFNLAHLR